LPITFQVSQHNNPIHTPTMLDQIFDFSKDTCVKAYSWGLPFQDITCQYPALDAITFEWEKKFDMEPPVEWMRENPYVPVVAVCLYVVFIGLGPGMMKNRESFGWRTALAMWNLFLSTFSIIGFTRVFPQLVHNYATMSVYENFCGQPVTNYGQGASGLWVMLFCLSKFPELIDTFFLVIHKKPVIFLHWYHHVTVLLYCWHSYRFRTSSGIIFCVMNYAVHGLMYFYYLLMAIKKRPKWFNPMWITYCQISQMFVGVGVTALSMHLKNNDADDSCVGLSQENNMAALVMYGSYLFLFIQFFVRRYFSVKSKKTN